MRVSSALRVDTLSYLVHNRAVLDYLAHVLVPYCRKTPTRIYFPVARTNIDSAGYRRFVNDKWLLGLADQRSDIFEFLDSQQHYHAGNEWLLPFVDLTNSNKHVRLSTQTWSDCEALVIRNPLGAALQLGDRGLQSVSVSETAMLRLEGPPRNYLCIRGPQTLDRNTIFLTDADPGIEIVRQAWTEFKFDKFPLQPAIVFLQIVDKEVRRIARELTRLVGGPALAIVASTGEEAASPR